MIENELLESSFEQKIKINLEEKKNLKKKIIGKKKSKIYDSMINKEKIKKFFLDL